MFRFVSFAGVALLFAAGACGGRTIDVPVRQPINFPHGAHLTYYTSGEHRAEGIAVHRDVVDVNDLPPELKEGRCAECHEDAELRECAACHVPSQNEALRRQKDVRKCVGCHRGAWGGSAATLPMGTACRACHGESVRLVRADGKHSTPVEGLVEDVPWVRINTLPPNVYFSHTPHVRYASMACSRCHQDVTGLKSPPTQVHAFTMSECLTCHAKNDARTDCLTCHK